MEREAEEVSPDRDGSRPGVTRTREFNVSRSARDLYGFAHPLFSSLGNRFSSHLQAIRELVHTMNRQRDVARHPEQVVHVSAVHALGLIDQVYHHLLAGTGAGVDRRFFPELLEKLYKRLGQETVDAALRAVTREFPPVEVYGGSLDVPEYLESVEHGETGKLLALEELLLLSIENHNPAFLQFDELVGSDAVRESSAYHAVVEEIDQIIATMKVAGVEAPSLHDLLLEPARFAPESLEAQLRYIREHWGGYLGDLVFKVLRGLDLFKEDQKGFFAPPGPPETRVYDFHGQDAELERFSQDRDWMPRVVLMAKNVLVWLYQLSRTYDRSIGTLDGIPDEELDRLAGWGFSGLWLIGIWERSEASRRIKRTMGNSEAEASAYSLRSYEIAEELGGWSALERLKKRCAARGIRLASDMVANHTGLDSVWMEQHPERFVQVTEPPFPSYSFSRENLSPNPGMEIYLEDHYYDRTDAAVVFKRVDAMSGEVRYIYHGNDGTHMPWNDTAQLDFLKPETREAVIETILHVARTFPIIRFDAAMTLARRHFHRLWYPEPGTGGDIPSRADHGLAAESLNAAMPTEFWRDVVDRVAAEVPDTLLLAEAFWMMEGYFVRTLGMHRVYNSAFMNMLKNEENAKYRETVKNTLEFDRNILKRFVNFMNNPDEETAVAQFGREDKYFGVCTMMATMPGLPMFGHGQVQGFTEKYGMEYRRAYLNEQEDPLVVARHEREIFPLLQRRYVFAEVDNFCLFDLYQNDGTVNENVFAYSNRAGREAALVVYNNALEGAWGWIRVSAAFAEKDQDGHRSLVQRDLADALGLHRDERHFSLFFETRSQLWYIRRSSDISENGLHVRLSGYQCQVFTGIREEEDTEAGLYSLLERRTAGHGVPDIDDALREIHLAPVYDAFAPVLARPALEVLFDSLENEHQDFSSFMSAFEAFVKGIAGIAGFRDNAAVVADTLRAALGAASGRYSEVGSEHALRLAAIAGWLVLSPLSNRSEDVSVVDEWELPRRMSSALAPFLDARYDWSLVRSRYESLLRIILRHDGWYEGVAATGTSAEPSSVGSAATHREAARTVLGDLAEDVEVAAYLGFNTFEDVVWFQKESFETLTWTLAQVAKVRELVRTGGEAGTGLSASVEDIASIAREWAQAEVESGYRVDRLLANEE